MTPPPDGFARFSVVTVSGRGEELPGLRLRRRVWRGPGMARRHRVTDAIMWGSPGVAEANPASESSQWGPWEPWTPERADETGTTWFEAFTSEPATRADLEAAEPLDLLPPLANLWRVMLMGADEPVIASWIDGLALATIRADGACPAWLDEGPAMDELRRPLRAALVNLAEALGVGELEHNAAAWVGRGWTAEDGAWWLSSRAGAWVRARWGEDAAPAAKDRTRWEEFAAGRASAWSLAQSWIDPEHPGPIPSPLVAWLAVKLWAREVRPDLERAFDASQRLRRNPEALVTLVHAGVGDAMARAPWANKPEDLPLLAVQASVDLAAQSLGTVQGHRLVRWLVWAANIGHHLGDFTAVELHPGVIAKRETVGIGLTIEGGLSGLAAALGDRSKRAPELYRKALMLLGTHALAWRYRDHFGAGSLLNVTGLEPEGGGKAAPMRRALLRIVVNPPLTPGVAPQLPRGSGWLVPVLPLPPLLGGRADPGLARLDWVAVRHLAGEMPEIAARGGAFMPWDRLAREAGGVSTGTLRRVLELWTSDTDDGAARWEKLDGDRWMLAEREPTSAARAFLLRGAKRFAHGREGGRGTAARAAGLELGPPRGRGKGRK